MSNEPIPAEETLLDGERPWPFSQAELTAGLRRHTGDTSLVITSIQEEELPQRRPSIGRVRGLHVTAECSKEKYSFHLVLKETQGSTRAGTAGAGLREISIYHTMREQLPVHLPDTYAYNPEGEWLVLEQLRDGRPGEEWGAADYLLATEHLATLHDRFWGLGEDLTIYRWLGRPLDAEHNIYLQAAENGHQRLTAALPNQLGRDEDFKDMVRQIITYSDGIRASLQKSPSTLLHGDYWAGNIHIPIDGHLTIFDWEMAAIGPGVLDLLSFIQASHWWFDPLPLDEVDITSHYRARIKQAIGYTWAQEEWEALWDAALLWTFVSGWIDLLASIPDTILSERMPLLEETLIGPVRKAVSIRLPETD